MEGGQTEPDRTGLCGAALPKKDSIYASQIEKNSAHSSDYAKMRGFRDVRITGAGTSDEYLGTLDSVGFWGRIPHTDKHTCHKGI